MSHDAEYWAKRALQREQEAYVRGAELSTKLYREYELATRRIRQQVSEFYGRYAAERGITYADAVRALNTRERQEWKKSLQEYLAEITAEEDPRVKTRLKAELDALSYNSQITRLEALHAQINQELNTLHARGVEQMKAEFGDLFTESFTRKMYDIQSRVGYVFEFAKIDTAMVENIVSYPWSGADFSARLWKNKQQLTFVMRETLTQGMINGTSVAQMSKTLSEAMGASYKAAERVVRTEANHFHNEATKRAYAAAGLDQYEYMATLDSRTSLVCQELDGKTFELDAAKEGENFPPMHPNCRSTTVEHDPEAARDWEAIGKPMPPRQTYEEWQAERESDSSRDDNPKTRKAVNTKLSESLLAMDNDISVIIPKGTDLKKVRIIAGDGVSTEYRAAKSLAAKYGGKPHEWMKKTSVCESDNRTFEIHWAEHPVYGMIESKVKSMKRKERSK